MNDLVLLKTADFNGIGLDCYKGDDESEFWATREQIGRLLGYKNPMHAIKDIHVRNKERLDKFSTGLILRQVEGNRTVTREVIVYNFKGLLEICRYSNQPKANAVIDFLWEIADDIRKHGMYLSPQLRELMKDNPHVVDTLVKNYLKLKDRVNDLEKQIADCQSYTVLGKIVAQWPGCITFGDGAHLLSSKGIHTGQNRLMKKARELGLLCKRKGKQWNQPTQKAIDKDLISTAISGGFKTIPMLTPAGLQFFTELLANEEYPLLVLITKADEQTV